MEVGVAVRCSVYLGAVVDVIPSSRHVEVGVNTSSGVDVVLN